MDCGRKSFRLRSAICLCRGTLLRNEAKIARLSFSAFTPEGGAAIPSSVASKNPTDELWQPIGRIDKSLLVRANISLMIAAIEQGGVPALRIAFTLAVIIFLFVGIIIFRRRHQFFDRDPNVENDVPVAQHNRFEEVLFVWSGLMLVLVAILYQVWRA